MDDLGDRMKEYERRETDRRFLPFVPLVARMDGRNFSKFTRDLVRPYDVRLSEAMVEATTRLVEETNALIGYTQSDEISLVWLTEDIGEEMMFNAKVQKLASVLAAKTTALFICELLKGDLAYKVEQAPHFDARVFQVPNKGEATNALLWRERDAAKNAVSMAARHYYSHSELQGKKSSEMQEMLFQKGVNFNDYPAFFKRGTFVQGRVRTEPMDEAMLAKIPEKHRPEDGMVTRRIIERIAMPIFSHVSNRVEVVFDRADPVTAE
jgi:tRNA(His) guanylyltransferase